MALYDVPIDSMMDPGVYGQSVQRTMPLFSTVGKGPQGDKGDKGDKGDRGGSGPQGVHGPKGEVGPQGIPGKDLTYDRLTERQKAEIYQKVSYVGNEVVDAVFTTSLASTTKIPIPIPDYDAYDILWVFIEGLMLMEHVDYEIDDDKVVLASPITHPGTKALFRALRFSTPDGEKNIIENIDLTRVEAAGASATVDASVGTPSVNVTLDEDTGSMAFAFHNLKGQPGTNGTDGTDGTDGIDGADGDDGITPTVSVTSITGGNNVAFSYGDGDPRNTNFNVMDGTDGSDGDDYVLTAQDKNDIATTVYGMLVNAANISY